MSLFHRWTHGLLLTLGTLSLCSTALALDLEDVLASSLKHFPQVVEALQKIEIEEAKLQGARGAFDAKIKGKVNARTRGYYDGHFFGLKVEKPLPFLNSKIYGGHRFGQGEFPSYEGKMDTLDQGETFVGLSVSLLRNLRIDQNRYGVRFQKEDRDQSLYQWEQVRLEVQAMATQAYWSWFAKKRELEIAEALLDLAQLRGRQIRRRVEAGDLAAIYKAENKQYIVKRQSDVFKRKASFNKAQAYLSLFYRDEKGLPKKIPAQSELPQIPSNLLKDFPTRDLEAEAIRNSPLLKIIASKEKQAELDVRLGRNDLLPDLDLQFEWSQDRGNGVPELRPEDHRVMLNLNVPLQRRKGLGKRRAGEAKLKKLAVKRRWSQEKMGVNIQNLITELQGLSQIYELSREQVSLAEKLAKAERKKFRLGSSDLILVNFREEAVAESQEQNLAAFYRYQYLYADLLKNLGRLLMKPKTGA